MAYGIMVVLALVYLALVLLLLVKLIEALVRIFGQVGFDRSRHVVDSGLIGACGMLGCCGSRRRNKRRGKGKNNGRAGKYKGSEIGTSPSSQNLGSTLLRDRRPSDLSSYNPPAALLRGDGGSESGSLMGPRFLGGADSRKGSTHSQPPSVLRPEHANQPYREETDMSWWNENEQQGGAFIMGAWQPFAGQTGNAQGNYVPVPNPQSPPQPSKPSPQAATPSTGFSRVGGGRAHIDSPYAIHPTGNNHSQSGFQNPSSSSQVFPSVAPQSAQFINASLPPSARATPSPTPVQSVPHSHQPSLSGSNAYPPSSFSRHYQPPPPQTYLDDEEPLPLSTVRQAHPGPMQMVVQPPHPQNDINQLPPGAMQPAHVRTKSQTAIIEDAGSFLYGPNSNNAGTSASQSGISARFSLGNPNHPPLQPITIPSKSGGLTPPNYQSHPTSAPPLSKFTLTADDDDNDDDESVAEDQQQKKKWYQLRKKRPHSSEGRTTTTATPTAPSGISGSSSSVPLPQDQEGNAGEGSAGIDGGATPQRSFVVIRKPMGSTGRLNQAGGAGAASGSGQTRSRPPTR